MGYRVLNRDEHLRADGQPKRILTLDGGGLRGILTIGQAISTKGMTHADVPKLKAAARAQIIALRAEILPLTVNG